ncbi:hypothetical protein [Ancylobacter lacus]|uniref:hypothetical protein n=1 Tax=Ancylobacter lacus TaxID=2579970 RepID=UPI001BCE7D86|nr:hypothetical protein [Ancylobacter lacus]MBS7540611.1 hypothetical protein [Ancylobacter lacus]
MNDASRGLGFPVLPMLAALAALAMAGCQTTRGPVATGPSASATSGAPVTAMAPVSTGKTVAFESIDGPPQPVFAKLVNSLGTGATRRQIDVVSRESAATYRVRGYLAASVEDGKGTVDWAWDVFDDTDRVRVMRVAGTEQVGSGDDVWDQLDQAELDRIAAKGLDGIVAQLADASDGNAAPAQTSAAPAAHEPAAVDGAVEIAPTEDGSDSVGAAASAAAADATAIADAPAALALAPRS